MKTMKNSNKNNELKSKCRIKAYMWNIFIFDVFSFSYTEREIVNSTNEIISLTIHEYIYMFRMVLYIYCVPILNLFSERERKKKAATSFKDKLLTEMDY